MLRFSPLFITGLAWPFYIGYLRGAISTDTMLERVRGWVYFCLGSSVWLALLMVTIVRDYYPGVSDSVFASLWFVYSIVWAIGFLVSYYVAIRLIHATNTKLSRKERAIIANTAWAAVLLSFFISFGSDHMRFLISLASQVHESEGVLVLIVNPWLPWLVLCFFAFVILERVTRLLAKASTQLEVMSRESIGPDLLTHRTQLTMMFAFMSGVVYLLIGCTSQKRLFWWTILSFVTAMVFAGSYPRGDISLALGLWWLVVSVLAICMALRVPITIPETDVELQDRLLRMFRFHAAA